MSQLLRATGNFITRYGIESNRANIAAHRNNLLAAAAKARSSSISSFKQLSQILNQVIDADSKETFGRSNKIFELTDVYLDGQVNDSFDFTPKVRGTQIMHRYSIEPIFLYELLIRYSPSTAELTRSTLNAFFNDSGAEECVELAKKMRHHNNSILSELQAFVRLHTDHRALAKIAINAVIRDEMDKYKPFIDAIGTEFNFFKWCKEQTASMDETGHIYSVKLLPRNYMVSQQLALEHDVTLELEAISNDDAKQYLELCCPIGSAAEHLGLIEKLTFNPDLIVLLDSRVAPTPQMMVEQFQSADPEKSGLVHMARV
jgi:hypothetical protein